MPFGYRRGYQNDDVLNAKFKNEFLTGWQVPVPVQARGADWLRLHVLALQTLLVV